MITVRFTRGVRAFVLPQGDWGTDWHVRDAHRVIGEGCAPDLRAAVCELVDLVDQDAAHTGARHAPALRHACRRRRLEVD